MRALASAILALMVLRGCASQVEQVPSSVSCSNGYVPQGDFSDHEFAYVCTMRADESPFKNLGGDDEDWLELANTTCDMTDTLGEEAALERLVSTGTFSQKEAGWLIGAAHYYCLDNTEQT